MINKNLITSTVLLIAGMSLVACSDSNKSTKSTSAPLKVEKLETFKIADVQKRINDVSDQITDKGNQLAQLDEDNYELEQKVKEAQKTMTVLNDSHPEMTAIIDESYAKISENNNEMRVLKNEVSDQKRHLDILLAEKQADILTKRIAKDKKLLISYESLIQFEPNKTGAINVTDVQNDIAKNEKTISELKSEVLKNANEFVRN